MSIFKTRLPVYYKRIQLKNSQMKETHSTGLWEGSQSFHTLTECAAFLSPLCVHRPRNSL